MLAVWRSVDAAGSLLLLGGGGGVCCGWSIVVRGIYCCWLQGFLFFLISLPNSIQIT